MILLPPPRCRPHCHPRRRLSPSGHVASPWPPPWRPGLQRALACLSRPLRCTAKAKAALDLLRPVGSHLATLLLVSASLHAHNTAAQAHPRAAVSPRGIHSTASPSGAGVEPSGAPLSMPAPLPQAGVLLCHHAPQPYGMLLTHDRAYGGGHGAMALMREAGEGASQCHRSGKCHNLIQRDCKHVSLVCDHPSPSRLRHNDVSTLTHCV